VIIDHFPMGLSIASREGLSSLTSSANALPIKFKPRASSSSTFLAARYLPGRDLPS
jgi:hypothetical protein